MQICQGFWVSLFYFQLIIQSALKWMFQANEGHHFLVCFWLSTQVLVEILFNIKVCRIIVDFKIIMKKKLISALQLRVDIWPTGPSTIWCRKILCWIQSAILSVIVQKVWKTIKTLPFNATGILTGAWKLGIHTHIKSDSLYSAPFQKQALKWQSH